MKIKNVTYKELNRLCWTEDNRLQAMSDRRNGAWYNYDATGERNLKLTGQTMHVNQNGQDYYTPIFDQQTLYANPLITINDRGYTKHYFEEGRRICSKIGSGDLLDINTLVPHMETPYEEQQNIQREGLEWTFRACMELTPEIATHNLYEKVVQPYEGQINPEEPIFYYHSDHLGSASFLTDRDGYETQQLVYLPFGEDWVDMKYNTSQYDTPYKFNGKEKDEETGYNNYGARYYYDWASIWLSVDPMSDKYPHLTSYNYCANNPVIYIDPDGKKIVFAKGVSDDFKKAFAQAVQHLNKHGAGGMLAQLEKSQTVYYIGNDIGDGGSHYDPATRTINWDPENGIITDELIIMSPTTVLNHEVDHALRHDKEPIEQFNDYDTKDAQYGDNEEKRVITGSEQTTARKLNEIKDGEVTRKNHNGNRIPVKDPTSTELKYSVTTDE